jgi:hypothetical protein
MRNVTEARTNLCILDSSQVLIDVREVGPRTDHEDLEGE